MMSPEEIAASVLVGLETVPNSYAQHTSSEESGEKAGQKKPSSIKEDSVAKGGKRRPKAVHEFPVEPRSIQFVNKVKDVMNHSYRDFSLVPADMNWRPKTLANLESMTFAEKVHHILSQDEYKKWIDWLPHGRSFLVKVPAFFERVVCPKYFGHKRFSSFLRQLNNHSFKHISKGAERNSYYHECFLRGMPHLCKYMPPPKDARRLIPDPENEPDFNAISKLYPLPDKTEAASVEATSVATTQDDVAAVESALKARLTSEVMWLSQSLPPAKRQSVGIVQHSQTDSFSIPLSLQLSGSMSQQNLGLSAHDASRLLAIQNSNPAHVATDLQTLASMLQRNANSAVVNAYAPSLQPDAMDNLNSFSVNLLALQRQQAPASAVNSPLAILEYLRKCGHN